MHSLSLTYAGNEGRHCRLVESSREVLPSLPASRLVRSLTSLVAARSAAKFPATTGEVSHHRMRFGLLRLSLRQPSHSLALPRHKSTMLQFLTVFKNKTKAPRCCNVTLEFNASSNVFGTFAFT